MFKQDNTGKRIKATLLFIGVVSACTIGCTNRNRQEIMATNMCDTTLTTYSAIVSNIITTKCNDQSGCHGSASPGSVSLQSYQNVKDRITDILDRIKSGNMPKSNPNLDDCTILKIETWANKGAINN